jgi:glutathione S-transferase
VTATLYSLSLSHPSHAARLMLERKGIEHEVKDLLPGFHPQLLRLAGFRGATVPALRIDGRRVQGSTSISRALDEIQSEPALFSSDQGRRRAIEAAEAWGDRVLQPVPRRIFRWGVSNLPELRLWLARDVVRMPAPSLMARLNAPIARSFARKVGATDAQIRSDLEQLGGLLDHVDEMIADGTIGQDEPNAADFQIGTTVRVFLAFADLAPLVEGRPAAALATHILPKYPGPVPPFLPQGWLAATDRNAATPASASP